MRTIKHCARHSTYAPKCRECWHRTYGMESVPQVSIRRSVDAKVMDAIMFLAGVIAITMLGVWIVTGGL